MRAEADAEQLPEPVGLLDGLAPGERGDDRRAGGRKQPLGQVERVVPIERLEVAVAVAAERVLDPVAGARCEKAKRPLSQSQPSSTSGWLRERIRFTLPSRVVALTLQPTGQRPHTVGTFWISQGRASKRYCVEVSAPTGQSSITLPENGAR